MALGRWTPAPAPIGALRERQEGSGRFAELIGNVRVAAAEGANCADYARQHDNLVQTMQTLEQFEAWCRTYGIETGSCSDGQIDSARDRFANSLDQLVAKACGEYCSWARDLYPRHPACKLIA